MNEHKEGYQFQGTGLTSKEKKWGEQRFSEYRINYPHLHKMSDLLVLEELIYQEALHERLKEKISQTTRKKIAEEKAEFPSHLQEDLKSSIDLQFKLKEKLGLFEDKKKLDAFRDFEQIREDFREYRKRNPHLFKTTCPRCSFEYFLKRRTNCYEEIESPWFKDKVLCNPELWDAYKCGEITKERTSRILGVSPDYIDWLSKKIFPDKEDPPAVSG
jgi:hypothetical protein